jgi:hypothetical protein
LGLNYVVELPSNLFGKEIGCESANLSNSSY